MRYFARSWPLWLLLPLACEPAPDVEPLVCRIAEPATLTVGLGDLGTGFVEIEDGDDVPVVLGPQGLHMIVVSVRLDQFEMPSLGDQTKVSIAIRQDGELVGGLAGDLPPTTVAGESVEFLGLRAEFVVAEIEPFVGKRADIVVTVLDGCGRDIRVSRSLRLAL